MICGSLRPYINGNYQEKGLLMQVDADGNLVSDFNQTGYMIFDYGMLNGMGWQGKFAVFYDVDVLSDGTLYATGKRNPIAGNTRASLFLLKLTGIELGGSIAATNELENLALEVYPNPTNRVIRLTIPESLVGKPLMLISANGEAVEMGVLNSTSVDYDISHLTNGVYFFQVKGPNGVLSKRFVKEQWSNHCASFTKP